MADKRSVSKKIVCDDRIIQLSHHIQLLYFHLIFNCDDKGYVYNYLAICRMLEIKETSINILIEFGYVETVGVYGYYVSHWLEHSTTYLERKLRTSHSYRKWKNAVLKRDDRKCVYCGSTKKLHVHHIKEFSTHPQLRLVISNGLTLCQKCHIDEHKTINNG